MLILDCAYDSKNDWSSLFSFCNFCKTSSNKVNFHVHVYHPYVITLQYLSVMLFKPLFFLTQLKLFLQYLQRKSGKVTSLNNFFHLILCYILGYSKLPVVGEYLKRICDHPIWDTSVLRLNVLLFDA